MFSSLFLVPFISLSSFDMLFPRTNIGLLIMGGGVLSVLERFFLSTLGLVFVQGFKIIALLAGPLIHRLWKFPLRWIGLVPIFLRFC